jgi:hypothetical protein
MDKTSLQTSFLDGNSQISAQAFYLIGQSGALTEAAFKFESRGSLPEKDKIIVLRRLEKIRAHCQAVGLTLFIKSAERLTENIRQTNRPRS